MVAWMERARAVLINYRASLAGADATPANTEVRSVAVTSMDHQESQTECGLYALYYIRRRLEGEPYSFFETELVPDSAMAAFRMHVFRCAK